MFCGLLHTTSVRIKIRALPFYPNLDLVAKNQALDSVAEPIKIKAFSAVGSQDFDRQLCPVQALLQYRKTTSSPGCMKGRKKLCLSYKPSKTDEIKIFFLDHQVNPSSLRDWGSNSCTLEWQKVSADEVRGLSAYASLRVPWYLY